MSEIKLDSNCRVCRSCQTRFSGRRRGIIGLILLTAALALISGAAIIIFTLRQPVYGLGLLIAGSVCLSTGGSKWLRRNHCPKCNDVGSVHLESLEEAGA